MDIERVQESLQAAQLCLQEDLANSAVSRGYYAMFQAAQLALEHEGFRQSSWSHAGLQATFTTELIRRRKRYPSGFRNFLSSGLEVRQTADYGRSGVSQKIAQRLVGRATTFVTAVEEGIHGDFIS